MSLVMIQGFLTILPNFSLVILIKLILIKKRCNINVTAAACPYSNDIRMKIEHSNSDRIPLHTRTLRFVVYYYTHAYTDRNTHTHTHTHSHTHTHTGTQKHGYRQTQTLTETIHRYIHT